MVGIPHHNYDLWPQIHTVRGLASKSFEQRLLKGVSSNYEAIASFAGFASSKPQKLLIKWA
jgi:hypothetical protein